MSYGAHRGIPDRDREKREEANTAAAKGLGYHGIPPGAGKHRKNDEKEDQ